MAEKIEISLWKHEQEREERHLPFPHEAVKNEDFSKLLKYDQALLNLPISEDWVQVVQVDAWKWTLDYTCDLCKEKTIQITNTNPRAIEFKQYCQDCLYKITSVCIYCKEQMDRGQETKDWKKIPNYTLCTHCQYIYDNFKIITKKPLW